MADERLAYAREKWGGLTPRQQGFTGCLTLVVVLGLGGMISNVFDGADEPETATAPQGVLDADSASGIDESDVEQPEPTDTDEPTATAEPTEAATDTPPTEVPTDPPPTQLPPTVVPTAVPPSAVPPTAIPPTAIPPTAEPAPPQPQSGAVGDLSEAPPPGQPWLPCAQGQIKGNINSKIYHPPSGASYGKTFRNVWCFNSAQEAEANGYRRAQR